jgi:glucosamine--fructose-6-phosphate aminotransferase (isomerizing)
MAAEIAEQPAVLDRFLAEGLRDVTRAAGVVRDRRPRFALLAARGTSDHAALYAKYLLEVRLGLPCGLVSASTLTAYGARPDLRDVLWLAVSQSGASPDLVESTRVAREQGALTLAVTNAAASPLAGVAEQHVDVLAGPERSVAATKSYTAQLLAVSVLVGLMADPSTGTSRVAGLPVLAERLLARGDAARTSARYRFVERLVTTARGFAYPTAREAALKLMETSYLSAHAFSAADLLHGPLAMIDQDRPVIAIVADGPGAEAIGPALDRLHEREADVLLVADEAVLAGWGGRRSTVEVPLPAGVPEDLAPILQILPLQQLAHAMAVARGHDPDAPRGLSKETSTW